MPSELPSSNTPSPKRPYPPSVKLILFVLGVGGTAFGLSQFVRSQVSDEAHMSATLLMICGIALLVMLFRDNNTSIETVPTKQTDALQEQTTSHSQDALLQEPAKSAPSAFDLAMSRSDNIPASLKDLIDTNQLQRPELQEMLVRSGLLDAHSGSGLKVACDGEGGDDDGEVCSDVRHIACKTDHKHDDEAEV